MPILLPTRGLDGCRDGGPRQDAVAVFDHGSGNILTYTALYGEVQRVVDELCRKPRSLLMRFSSSDTGTNVYYPALEAAHAVFLSPINAQQPKPFGFGVRVRTL